MIVINDFGLRALNVQILDHDWYYSRAGLKPHLNRSKEPVGVFEASTL